MNEGDGQHSQGYPELPKPKCPSVTQENMHSDTHPSSQTPSLTVGLLALKHLLPHLAIIGATWLKAMAGPSTHTRDVRVALLPLLIVVRCRIHWPNNHLHVGPRARTTTHPPAPLPNPPATPCPAMGHPRSQRLKPYGGSHGGTGNKQLGEDSQWSSSPGHKSPLRLWGKNPHWVQVI